MRPGRISTLFVHAELRFLIRYPLIDCSLSKDHGEQVPRLSTLDAQRVPAGFSWKLPQPGLRQLLPPPVPVQQRIPPHRHADLARSSLAGLSQGESRMKRSASFGWLLPSDRPAETPTNRNWGPKRPTYFECDNRPVVRPRPSLVTILSDVFCYQLTNLILR